MTNLVRRDSRSSGDFTTYAWDHRNRLIQVEQGDGVSIDPDHRLDLHYNADDQLVTRLAYHRDSFGLWRSYGANEEYVSSGGERVLTFDPSDTLKHRTTWAPGVDNLLVDEVFDASGHLQDTLWAATDHLGSVNQLINNHGTVVEHREYDSFGAIDAVFDQDGTDVGSDNMQSAVGFAGREWDEHADSYYNRARWYDANTGRFSSEDPAEAGSNWYRYAGNDPVNFTDPTGLRSPHPLDAVTLSAHPNGAYGGLGGPATYSPFTDQLFNNAISALSPTRTSTFATPSFSQNPNVINSFLGAGSQSTSSFSFPSTTTLSDISVPNFSPPSFISSFTTSSAEYLGTNYFNGTTDPRSNINLDTLAFITNPDHPAVGGGRDEAGFRALSDLVSGLGRGVKDTFDAVTLPLLHTAVNFSQDPLGTIGTGISNVGSSIQTAKDTVSQYTVGNFFAEGRARNLAEIEAGVTAIQNQYNAFVDASPHDKGRAVGQITSGIIAALTPTGRVRGATLLDDVIPDNNQLNILNPHFVPNNKTRRDFGTLVHQDVPAGMQERFPNTMFQFNVGPGQKGPDVEVLPGGTHPGFDFADLKPRTESGFNAFQHQIQAWPNGDAGVFFYDPATGAIDFENIIIFKEK